ncbi:hypothetical protein SO802_032164 [Lithocarpus litseifolius]|uniref:UspA domain-containing protein n=1 Tax=Lithocarpus litseifolius TaxID=425828 RepID=A0AAW2BPD3_9ROSI
MKERLCLEVERLGLGAVIMGSWRFGAVRRGNDDGRLSSVSDYCVHHCVCPIIVVRYPEDKDVVAEAVLAVKEGEEDDEYGVVVRRFRSYIFFRSIECAIWVFPKKTYYPLLNKQQN